jgi:undecaprenyl diphosphate synthase
LIKENFKGLFKTGSREARLFASLDLERLPRHIAIIMDGNGRWAKLRGKPRISGHKAGAESVRAIIDTLARLEIEAVTLYAFSTENWKRPKNEVTGLMSMLKHYLRKELQEVRKHNIRFVPIGNINGLSADVQKEIDYAVRETANNSGMAMCVALNYGGRAEILRACKRAAEQALERGDSTESIIEEDIERNLYTAGLPEVDLMIRTSGEFRISNFLLWQLAYSEIYVTATLFPDFRRAEIFEALADYQKRHRRFGDIK